MVEELLLRDGFKPNTKGFEYLCEAINLAYNKKMLSMNEIYDTVSKSNLVKDFTIREAIRYAIRSSGKSGTNKCVIARYVIELKKINGD